MKDQWQQTAAKKDPIKRTGCLNNDRTARWAGLLLRTEAITDNIWWWDVIYEAQSLGIDSPKSRTQLLLMGTQQDLMRKPLLSDIYWLDGDK